MDRILTSCIIQTIIICCTIVIVASIGVSAYRINKKMEQSWGNYIFLASIILVLGIVVFSYAFYGNRNVLDFISLASALISIILAIVTIVYSFYSNSRSFGQVEILNKAAQDVKDATISYSNSAESLQENIQLILETVLEVKDYTKRTNNAIANSYRSEGARSVIDGMTADNRKIGNLVDNYVTAGAFIGNLGLLACVYSKNKNRPFSFTELNSIAPTDNFMSAYICGYIIASSALGIVDAHIENHKIYVESVLDNLQDKLEYMINDYISHKESKKQKEANQKLYNGIKQIFDIK